MKKPIFTFLALALLLISSCSKPTNNSLSAGSWTFKGTTTNATSCDTISDGLTASSMVSGNLSTYGSLTFSFYYALHTITAGTYAVANGYIANSASQVSIALTGGGVSNPSSYWGTGGNGTNQIVRVAVSNGKISISGSGIEMLNTNSATDSSTLVFNITETQ